MTADATAENAGHGHRRKRDDLSCAQPTHNLTPRIHEGEPNVLDHRSAVTLAAPVTHHRTTKVDGVNIVYREAGPARAPVVPLLHGFPTSSHMLRTPSA